MLNKAENKTSDTMQQNVLQGHVIESLVVVNFSKCSVWK